MTYFSIIIPCFEVAAFIDETITSVLKQDYRNYELILVDDGSKDETPKKMEFYRKDKRVRVVSNLKNSGVSFTRNKGIEIARGDFLLFLDADDLIRPGLLFHLDMFIKENPEVDLISFGYTIEKNQKYEHLGNQKYNDNIFSSNQFLKLYLSRKIRQHLCSLAVSTNLIRKSGIRFDENTFAGEDQEFQIRAMNQAGRVGYLSQEYFNYRIRNDSFMHAPFQEKRLGVLQVLQRLYKLLENDVEIYPHFVNYASMEYYSLLKHGLKSQNQDLILKIKTEDWIVARRGTLYANKQALVTHILKLIKKVDDGLLNKLLYKL